jgi:hypothetical protein
VTTWTGSAQTTVRMPGTGKYGGSVRVEWRGKIYLAPRHVFLQVIGDDGLPDLDAHFEWRDGRPQVVELALRAKPDGRGVATADLDALSLDTLARDVMIGHSRVLLAESEAATASALVDWDAPGAERERWALDAALASTMATRRKRIRTAELERVAALCQEFRGRNMSAAVATALGVSERTAARRIAAAKAAGLLETNTTEGG